MRDLADSICTLGLSASVVDRVDGLRMTACDFLNRRFPQHGKDFSFSPWDKAVRDWLLAVVKPLIWCSPSFSPKHETAEIVSELRSLAVEGNKYTRTAIESEQLADEENASLPCSPEEALELVDDMRLLAVAVDASGKGSDTILLAGRIGWSLASWYDHIHVEQEIVGPGHTWSREKPSEELTVPQLRFMSLVSAAHTLTDDIARRAAPVDVGKKIRSTADALGKVIDDLSKQRGCRSGTQRLPAADGSGTLALDDEDVKILRYLAEQSTCKVQVDIEQGSKVSRKTIGKRLVYLRSLGYVTHPTERNGDMITPSGLERVRQLPIV